MKYVALYLGIMAGDKYDIDPASMPGPSWEMTQPKGESRA